MIGFNNITDWIEGLDRTRTLVFPPPYENVDNEVQTESLGDDEVVLFSGQWSDALEFAQTQGADGLWPAAIGSEGLIVSAVITRKGGGAAECEVTRQKVIGAIDGSTSSTGAGAVGSSDENPEVEVQTDMVAQSILLDPRWDNFSTDSLNALNMLVQGGALSDFFTPANGQAQTLRKFFEDNSLVTEAKLVMRTPMILVPRTTVTVSYRVAATTLIPAVVEPTIVESINGVAPLSGDRNFLLIKRSAAKKGGKPYVVEVYELSGVSGWSKTLYPS